MSKTDTATIREVYAITQRLEDKIDAVDKKVSNMEGKASIAAIVWSSFIGIVSFLLKK